MPVVTGLVSYLLAPQSGEQQIALGAGTSNDHRRYRRNRSDFHDDLVPRPRSGLLVNSRQTFAISRQLRRRNSTGAARPELRAIKSPSLGGHPVRSEIH